MTDIGFFLIVLGTIVLALVVAIILLIMLWGENDELRRKLDAANRLLPKEERKR